MSQEPGLSWTRLQNEIVQCKRCPRLVNFRERVAREKKKEFKDFEYWGKPVPSNGKPDSRLVIIGLAPAAHGGNRTGRMFTGDNSARFLFRHLYKAGFSNQPTSEYRGDGLELRDCYITAAVRCVPPENKPARKEIENCSGYLDRELKMLPNVRVILALGKLAFDSTVNFYKLNQSLKGRFQFRHGTKYPLGRNLPILVGCYHPSPRNTNTGKLTNRMFMKVLNDVKESLS
jgi:uracil-DNA glycosylase